MTQTAKTSAVRLYIINEHVAETNDAPAHENPVALVLAANPAQALKHFTSSKYAVRYAEQMDVFNAAQAGVKPEKAAVDTEGD